MSGDPLEAQSGIVGEGGGEMTKHSRGTQAGDKRGLKKGLRVTPRSSGSRLGTIGHDWNLQVIKLCKILLPVHRFLLEGKGFSCEAGGNLDQRNQDKEFSSTVSGIWSMITYTLLKHLPETKKGGDKSVSPYLDIRRGQGGWSHLEAVLESG